MISMSDETLPATVKLSTTPATATEQARTTAVYLKKLLDNKPKPVMINGKRHMEFDDWITLGNYYGISVETGEAEPIEVFGVPGFKATAKVVRIDDGVVIGGAEAYCLSDERNWKGKPMFQLASMAQTRSGSKALANVLRWVVALEGISGTPAEEMTRNNRPARTTQPAPTKAVKAVRKPAPPQREPADTVEAEVTKKKPAPKKSKAKPATPKKVGEAEVQNVINWTTEAETNTTLRKILHKIDTLDEQVTTENILTTGEDMLSEQLLTVDGMSTVRRLAGAT